MQRMEFPPPPDISWSARQLVHHLSLSLASCSSRDIILSATGGRDRFYPFTEFPLMECHMCNAVYDKVEEFLRHILKTHFGEKHMRLYEELGLVHKDVQNVLDEARSQHSPYVGRALQNSQELCVLTPLSSPLAPYMLAGVTVSTREPNNKLAFALKVIEGPNVEHIPIYFCVSSVHKKFSERTDYIAAKRRKRTFRELKSCLKSFRIDVQDLLEHPPKSRRIATLLHKATGFPIGSSLIPARKIRLVVPVISSFDDVK